MHPHFIIGPRLCACGCGTAILPQRHHRYYGTPLFLPGHNNAWGTSRREVRNCPECGETWETVKSDNRVYCSTECTKRAIRNRVITTCLICGRDVERRVCQGHYIYCSRACYAEHMRRGYRAGIEHPMYGRRGEAAPNWRGGVTVENQILRQSLEYRVWRTAVFERDSYTCQRCGDARGGNLRAHHIERWADNRELRFDVENGTTVCEPCHIAIHQRAPLPSGPGQGN